MIVKTFEDYKRDIMPQITKNAFDGIIRQCKSMHKVSICNLYAPNKPKFDSKRNPIILARFRFDDNLYEMPLNCLISIDNQKALIRRRYPLIKAINYDLFNYTESGYLEK